MNVCGVGLLAVAAVADIDAFGSVGEGAPVVNPVAFDIDPVRADTADMDCSLISASDFVVDELEIGDGSPVVRVAGVCAGDGDAPHAVAAVVELDASDGSIADVGEPAVRSAW